MIPRSQTVWMWRSFCNPERFPKRDPQRAALRAVEDAVEQNGTTTFDGIIQTTCRSRILREKPETAGNKNLLVSDEDADLFWLKLKASQARSGEAAEAEARNTPSQADPR
jgi:hypothetical protein